MLANVSRRRGATKVEIAVMVALVCVVAFAAVTVLHNDWSAQFTSPNQSEAEAEVRRQLTGPWNPDEVEEVEITVKSVAQVSPDKVLVQSDNGQVYVQAVRKVTRRVSGGGEIVTASTELTASLLQRGDKARLVLAKSPALNNTRTIMAVTLR